MNRIIVRTCGERTTARCIELAQRHGAVDVVNAIPFGESIRQTYAKALEYEFLIDWVAVVDADVLLFDHTIKNAMTELRNATRMGQDIFCLDGRTDDKIMLCNRRAGIHIYKVSLLRQAMQFIEDDVLKPESNVRRKMAELGHVTHVSKIVFGRHDYDQFYADLWRKSVCQTQKLKGMIKNQPARWYALAKSDPDYRVIYAAHLYGKQHAGNIKIRIDKNYDYNAIENIEKLGLVEKLL